MVGKVNEPPAQIGATCVKVGIIGLTIKVIVATCETVPDTPAIVILYVPGAKPLILFKVISAGLPGMTDVEPNETVTPLGTLLAVKLIGLVKPPIEFVGS